MFLTATDSAKCEINKKSIRNESSQPLGLSMGGHGSDGCNSTKILKIQPKRMAKLINRFKACLKSDTGAGELILVPS